MAVAAPLVSPGDLFAFYGLLKQGATGMPAHIDLAAAGRFEGPCLFRGSMYDLGGYPGVVAGDALCRAEKWRIADPSIVAALDAFEDIDPADAGNSLYLRRRTELLGISGVPTGEVAFVYWFNRAANSFPFIANGNWPLEAGRTCA